jgi:hypothetical protein
MKNTLLEIKHSRSPYFFAGRGWEVFENRAITRFRPSVYRQEGDARSSSMNDEIAVFRL